jgi:hypothetical protein
MKPVEGSVPCDAGLMGKARKALKRESPSAF